MAKKKRRRSSVRSRDEVAMPVLVEADLRASDITRATQQEREKAVRWKEVEGKGERGVVRNDGAEGRGRRADSEPKHVFVSAAHRAHESTTSSSTHPRACLSSIPLLPAPLTPLWLVLRSSKPALTCGGPRRTASLRTRPSSPGGSVKHARVHRPPPALVTSYARAGGRRSQSCSRTGAQRETEEEEERGRRRSSEEDHEEQE